MQTERTKLKIKMENDYEKARLLLALLTKLTTADFTIIFSVAISISLLTIYSDSNKRLAIYFYHKELIVEAHVV